MLIEIDDKVQKDLEIKYRKSWNNVERVERNDLQVIMWIKKEVFWEGIEFSRLFYKVIRFNLKY